MILSASSPFFQTILKKHHHKHTLLYLKDVKFVDLVNVLDFIYHGEVKIAQEKVNSFLSVAEGLKIKGLTQTNARPAPPPQPEDDKIQPSVKSEPMEQSDPTPSYSQVPQVMDHQSPAQVEEC